MHSAGNGACRSCGAKVTWVENIKTGKKIPIDGHDIAFLSVGYHKDMNGHEVQAGHVQLSVPKECQGIDTPMHTSHFATCPDAAKFRR
jgi:hypothetical protein